MSQISQKSFEDGETSFAFRSKVPFLLSNGQNDAVCHGFVSRVVSSHFTTDKIFANGGWREKFSFHITHGHGFAFCPEKVARYFQKALYYTTDISLPFFKYRRRKNVPAFEKRGHHDLRILRFERTASTAAVRTRGDFGIIPSPLHLARSLIFRRQSIMNHSAPGACLLHELQIKAEQHGADRNTEQHP